MIDMKHFWHTNLRRKTQLTPGCMTEEHFNKLMNISTIHSEKVLLALEDYCVRGSDRKSACERFNVSQGYFSICLRKLQRLNLNVADMVRFYIKGIGM